MARFQGYREDPENPSVDLSYLKRLWPFVRPYRRAFGGCLLMLLASFGLELLGPFLVRWAVDGPVRDAVDGRAVDVQSLWLLGGGYLAMTVGAISLGYAYGMLTALNGQRVVRDVRMRLFSHLLYVSPRFYDRNPAGKLVTRVTSDVENLNELISTGVLQTLFDLLKIVGILAVLFFIAPKLALFLLLATPVVIAASLVFRRFIRASYRAVRGRLAHQNAFLAESVAGVRTTRVFGQERAVLDHFRELNGRTRGAWLRTVFHFSLFFSGVDLAIRLTQIGILWVGGNGILDGALTAGVFMQFWLYFQKLTDPIRELGEKYNVLQSAFSSSERIFQILDEPIAPATEEAAAVSKPSPRGPARLEFDDVSFGYRDDQPVLRDVSFVAEPGQTVAIVGPTGAGKTTLLSLVSRLQDPSGGTVSLDGSDLRELDLFAMRRRIAVVQQDVFLFTGTVLDNVRLFDESISTAQVRAALETVGALEFVEALPGGLDAPVEERGATFSQGERQLLSFARALATEPDVLLLDEATASIDTATELRLQSALARLMRGRTSLVVAHRLSTVRDADRILVLEGGRVVEAGTHKELVELGGVFAGMMARA